MDSIDQYYVLARAELQRLRDECDLALKNMPTERAGRQIPDIRAMEDHLRTANRLVIRYQFLHDLGIADVSGSYPDKVTFTRLPGAENFFTVPKGTEPL
jgi:hypothetical protein